MHVSEERLRKMSGAMKVDINPLIANETMKGYWTGVFFTSNAIRETGPESGNFKDQTQYSRGSQR